MARFVSGIILFIVCLSGTLLVFQDEVRHIAEPAKYYVDVPTGNKVLPVDDLIAKIETTKPEMKVASISIPEKPNRTVTMKLVPANQKSEQR